MTPTFTSGADLFGSWFADVERGEAPVRFRLPDPFAALDVRPGRLILFGGQPGSGKTAALLQVGIDLLRLNESARLLVANVEMSPPLLVERVASRLSAVPLTRISDRELSPEELERVRAAVASLEPIAGRLAFLNPPYSLEHVAAAGTAFGANVLALDYIQRFTVGDGSKERREQLETAADVLRRFGDAGAAVLVASAVSRQKGAHGSTYRGLNLASFRGSSELEYGADAAYLLEADEAGGILFRCEKNRYAAVADVPTSFDPTTQTFTPALAGLDGFDAATPAPTRGGRRRGADVRRLTLREVNEEHGGILPPDATLRPDEEPARPAPPAKPKRRSGRGERFAALNAFTDCALAELTGAETKVWLILFRDAKAATGTVCTGQADIARRAGLKPRMVRYALASLAAKGMVHVVRRGRLNAGPSVYRVHPTGNA